MPNLWTLGIQMIEEAFNGPRTKDGEFDLKVDELAIAEKSVVALKNFFLNITNHIKGIIFCYYISQVLKIYSWTSTTRCEWSMQKTARISKWQMISANRS